MTSAALSTLRPTLSDSLRGATNAAAQAVNRAGIRESLSALTADPTTASYLSQANQYAPTQAAQLASLTQAELLSLGNPGLAARAQLSSSLGNPSGLLTGGSSTDTATRQYLQLLQEREQQHNLELQLAALRRSAGGGNSFDASLRAFYP